MSKAIRYRTVKQVADQLQVDQRGVLANIHSGRLEAINVSSGKRPTWRISPAALESYLAAATHRSAPKTARRARQKKSSEVIQFF